MRISQILICYFLTKQDIYEFDSYISCGSQKKIDDRKQRRRRTLTGLGEVLESDAGRLKCCPEVMDLNIIWAEVRCGVARLGPSWAE